MGSITNEFTQRIDALTAQKDSAYSERNSVVALVAKMAIALGFKAGLGKHDPADASWDDDWRSIVFIELPSGQVSWHLHDSDLPKFAFLLPYEGQWDGHTTEAKYQLIEDLTVESLTLGKVSKGKS
ncbi:MAG TPA: hypothetical protein V6C57_21430 [Coleofasciculaceae cyanobacterium]